MSSINKSILCAGFGGQGIITLGKVLANAGMLKDLHVTWLPSYGAEVRGGTAHSMVKISSEPIGNPVVVEADTEFIMNGPSLDKFENKIVPGGLLILNSSMVNREVRRDDIDVISVPLTDEAMKLGNVRVANMIAVGIFMAKTSLFDKDVMLGVIETMAGARKELMLINVKALERGMELAEAVRG